MIKKLSVSLPHQTKKMISRLKSITDTVFGRPKSDYGSSGWYEYNCPICRNENGGEDDNRHNLAILLNPEKEGRLWGHCWRCGYSGSLTKLIRENGTETDIERLSDIISDINGGCPILNSETKTILSETEVKLPDGFSTDFNSRYGKTALQYLYQRGISDDIIKRFNIGYTNPYQNSVWIVIPSYDKYGILNYWASRECFGNGKLNPKSDKKAIIFNENRINWYEPVTIVEGPFDHIVVPNSIPLLGKQMDFESAVYKAIYEKSKAGVLIMLDPDARKQTVKLYRMLESGRLLGKILIAECYDDMDASDIYREYGKKGILSILSTAKKAGLFD